MKELLKRAVPNSYAEEYAKGTNIVLLDSDVHRAFPTSEAVHEALRLVMKMAAIPVQQPTMVKED